jgi:predicted RNA-binding Zn-ribbon protein involved in translation (DUF1610 family)
VAKKKNFRTKCHACGMRARFAKRATDEVCLECGRHYPLRGDGKRVIGLEPSGETKDAITGRKLRATPKPRSGGGARQVSLWSGTPEERR